MAPALGAVVGRAFRRPGLGRGPPQPAEPAPHTLLIRAPFLLTRGCPGFGRFLAGLTSSATSSPPSTGSPPALVLDADCSLIASQAPSLR